MENKTICNDKINHCIGVVSYCNSEEDPERFEIIKKTLPTLSKLKNKNNYMFLWDNGSTEDVKEFQKSLNFFDDKYFSCENLYDVGPNVLLNKISKRKNAKFVTYIEDDLLLFAPEKINACLTFLENNPDCGTVRLLKYERGKEIIYDKMQKNPQTDLGNCIRHYNDITKEKLVWENCKDIDCYKFYKNNWHWTQFPNISRTEIFDKIIVKYDCMPLNGFEGELMKNFDKLALKVGILEGGAFSHIQKGFSGKASLRVRETIDQKPQMVSYENVLSKIDDIINNRV